MKFPFGVMDPGIPFTEEEAAHVERALLHLVTEGKTYADTSTFIRSLGWPQRRFPDLRFHLWDNPSLAKSLSEKTGKAISPEFLCSRNTLAVHVLTEEEIVAVEDKERRDIGARLDAIERERVQLVGRLREIIESRARREATKCTP